MSWMSRKELAIPLKNHSEQGMLGLLISTTKVNMLSRIKMENIAKGGIKL